VTTSLPIGPDGPASQIGACGDSDSWVESVIPDQAVESSGGGTTSSQPGPSAGERPAAGEVLYPTRPGGLVDVEPGSSSVTVPVESEARPTPEHVRYDARAWPPLLDAPDIGDPGRQREVRFLLGDLTPGVPDTVIDFATIEPFEVRACATRGMSHRQVGTPRQDWFAVAATDDWLALAVADGVSQAPLAHIASETASRAAVKLALDALVHYGPIDWDVIGRRISMAIAREATFRGLVPPHTDDEEVDELLRVVREHMCTTLVVAGIARHPSLDGRHLVRVAVIAGDSGAFSIHDGAFRQVAGGKDADSEIASTSVRPLPGHTRITELSTFLDTDRPFFLMSDGIGDPLGGSAAFSVDLAGRWVSPPTAADFLADLNFFRRTYDDDRTAVGVWRLPLARQTQTAVSASEGLSTDAGLAALGWHGEASQGDPERG
jgi:hypothetical protein